jgi:hypothetical protein
MTKANVPFSWKVKYFNCNAQRIEDYDMLKGRYKDFIKKLKKKCVNKAEFSEAMDREMMYRFWSRAEWELVIELSDDNRIWLNPWVGCREPADIRIDVTDAEDFDWRGFINTQYLHNNCQKIDVYDQLKYRWDDFITFLWTTRLKYERWHPKFEE